jgi:hypothetical protein
MADKMACANLLATLRTKGATPSAYRRTGCAFVRCSCVHSRRLIACTVRRVSGQYSGPARTHAVALDCLRLRVFPPGHAMVPGGNEHRSGHCLCADVSTRNHFPLPHDPARDGVSSFLMCATHCPSLLRFWHRTIKVNRGYTAKLDSATQTITRKTGSGGCAGDFRVGLELRASRNRYGSSRDRDGAGTAYSQQCKSGGGLPIFSGRTEGLAASVVGLGKHPRLDEPTHFRNR